MPQYLVTIHHPDDYDASVEDEAMGRDIDVLNEEMIAAGVRVFVGGLHPVKSAKSLRAQPGGKVLITDGPYLETRFISVCTVNSTSRLPTEAEMASLHKFIVE